MDESSNDSELWHVELPTGEVHVITLDQLDDAFDRGLVNEQTRVWQEGMEAAVSLGELLGRDEEEEPAPVLAPPPPVSVAPQMSAARPASVAPRASVRPVESAWPPVVQASVTAPPVSVAPNAPSSVPMNAYPSVRPMAFDVGDDFESFAKPRRGGKFVLALAALLALGGGVFAFVNGVGAAPTTEVAAAPPAPAPEPPKSHAYDPGNEPVHLKDVPAVPEITKPDAPAPTAAKPSAKEAATLREAALAAANSKVKSKTKAVTAHRAAVRGKASTTSYKGTKSGSKYDPLNGAL